MISTDSNDTNLANIPEWDIIQALRGCLELNPEPRVTDQASGLNLETANTYGLLEADLHVAF